jgi:YegS/Rv2252/BmrU family lipid kinase
MLPLIIVNHAAARARTAWPVVQRHLGDAGLEFDLHQTSGPGDATTVTRTALRQGCQMVVVVGGDGTLSEAAAGFFDLPERLAATDDQEPTPINPAAALAILPAGTGDDFARGLAGHRAPLASWLETVIGYCRNPRDSTRLVDVLYGRSDGYTNPFICLNAATLGIGGETARRVAGQGKFWRRFSGEARFVVAAIGALAAWRERPVRVTVDDQVSTAPMNLVGIANGLYAGGGMMFSPAARVDDGKLDVVTASGLSRLMIVRELQRIHTGGHLANPRVRMIQGRRASVETDAPADALLIEGDGNLRGRTPVDFRVVPRALRFVYRNDPAKAAESDSTKAVPARGGDPSLLRASPRVAGSSSAGADAALRR